MGASVRRHKFVYTLRPWLGLAIAGAAVVLGLRAIAAGTAGAGLAGYAAGSVELGAGFVAGRHALGQRFDLAFGVAVTVVFILGLGTFFALEPPPTVYEQLIARQSTA